jgi:predicted nucleic acid-binding protein
LITLDTSGLLALIDTRDRAHAAAVAAFDADRGPFYIPVPILAEIAWLMENRFRPEVEYAFLDDVRQGAYVLDWHDDDVARVEELVKRYADLQLGLADSAVVATAERHGGRILTTDRRHFTVVARGEHTITVLPE